jgi:hypothetical protein
MAEGKFPESREFSREFCKTWRRRRSPKSRIHEVSSVAERNFLRTEQGILPMRAGNLQRPSREFALTKRPVQTVTAASEN